MLDVSSQCVVLWPVLTLPQVPCVRQLHHLPELAALQSDLLRAVPLSSHPAEQTVAQALQKIPDGVF